MTRRGWCPSLYEPMQAADGLLVRVKPTNSSLGAREAKLLAAAATRFGRGAIELTNRANLQFRGLTEASATAFANVVLAAGLASPDPSLERRRTLIVSPLLGIDPTIDPATSAIANAITALLADPAFADLPGKFGITLDGGGHLPLDGAPGDIVVSLCGQASLRLEGSNLRATCPADTLIPALRRLITHFLGDPTPHRIRDIDPAAAFAAANLTAEPHPTPQHHAAPIGRIGMLGFGIGLPFGQIDAAGLSTLADIALSNGDGTIRLTPWRTLILPGVQTIEAPDLITDPASPLLRIDACTGSPACSQSTVTTRADANWLAKAGIPAGIALHISGCPKGCAHPASADLTLVGDTGRYNLIRHGRADAEPTLRHLTLPDIAALLAAESPT